jgi:carboxyl-terminal processing protease
MNILLVLLLVLASLFISGTQHNTAASTLCAATQDTGSAHPPIAAKLRITGDVQAAWQGQTLTAAKSKSGSGTKDKKAPKKDGKSKKDAKPRKIPPIFLEYLKDPSKLGFAPDESLFKKVYSYLKTFYVDPVNEKALCEGLLDMVKILLRDAKISSKKLAAYKSEEDVNALYGKIMKEFGRKVDKSVLTFACIQGMISGTKDPHSVLMTPRDYDFMMERLQNKDFSGIGIYIEKSKDNHNYLTVIEPIEGTPAYKAGLQPGDSIVKVEGKDTSTMTMEECVALIRGPQGTEVKLLVQRKGGLQKEYVIRRASIHVPSVTYKMQEGQIGYVRLRSFGVDSGSELGAAIADLKSKGAKALILDLRNNTGGYINAAVDVCSYFLKEGSLVVYTIDRNKSKRDLNSHAATGADLPLALLINEFSASASEITAGAIQDYGLGTLIGTKSFGKGSVQQPFPLMGGSILKLTVAHFYTPKGHKINGKGVTPGIEVKQEPKNVGKDEDLQLKKALEVLKAEIKD